LYYLTSRDDLFNLYTPLYTTRKERFCCDLKFCWTENENNFVETLKIMSNAAKNLDVLTTSSSVTSLF